MPARRTLLKGSAAGAGRTILRKQLQTWLKAHRKLARRQVPGALHDFRVALRRVRSTLRAFRPFLQHPKGLRRRLRRLARTTNESRNLEIWRDWIAQQSGDRTVRQRVGVRWLRSRLTERQQQAEALMREHIENWLPRLRKELRLVSSARGGPGGPPAAQPAGPAIARVIRSGTRVLAHQLGNVSSMKDRDPAHAARIATKRLRYLLEPLRGELSGAGAVLDQLEELQTVLGEVHDAHIFADELCAALAEASEQRARSANARLLPWPGAGQSTSRAAPPRARAGLLALARELRSDGEHRFERLQGKWLAGEADRLLAGLNRLARQCAAQNRGGRI